MDLTSWAVVLELIGIWLILALEIHQARQAEVRDNKALATLERIHRQEEAATSHLSQLAGRAAYRQSEAARDMEELLGHSREERSKVVTEEPKE
jgi:hypothetical protein